MEANASDLAVGEKSVDSYICVDLAKPQLGFKVVQGASVDEAVGTFAVLAGVDTDLGDTDGNKVARIGVCKLDSVKVPEPKEA